jgi:CBS domain-containing protein
VQCTTFQYITSVGSLENPLNSLETISVFSIMTRDVKTEKEDQNVLTTCRIMYENNIGSIIIVNQSDNNNPKPVGIITERDIVRMLGSLKTSLLQTPLRNIMSKPLVNVSINSSVRDAIQTMQQKNIRRLIVSDGRKQ